MVESDADHPQRQSHLNFYLRKKFVKDSDGLGEF